MKNSKGEVISRANFYNKVPKKYTDLAVELQKFFESQGNDYDIDSVMNEYFRKHWIEFKSVWFAMHKESIEWITFALAPHNGTWFTTYCFWMYEDLYNRVKKDLGAAKKFDEESMNEIRGLIDHLQGGIE